ncbi:MAG: ubiquinol-cytochrome c reductase iron-sulfur subunit [Candidatus Bipolaricaulia bacterium]
MAHETSPVHPSDGTTRRDWLGMVLMGVGLTLGYGVLAVEGLMFLLPERLRPRTRRLFAGLVDRYQMGSVQRFHDLQGNEILVKRSESGFQAFSSVCPHLGCRVHWEADKQRFFCPCHGGVFDADGVATAGPPAAAGQRLSAVPLDVDEAGGVIYIEVKDVKRRRT